MPFTKLILKFARQYPGWIILTIFLGFIAALFNGVSTTLIVPVILIILGQNIDLNNLPNIMQIIIAPLEGIPYNYKIVIMTGVIILGIIIKNIASYSSALSASYLIKILTIDLRKLGLELLLEVDLEFYAKTRVGDLINRLGGEIGRAANAINNLIRIIITGITILVFVFLLLVISWQLTLITSILLSLVALANQYVIEKSRYFGKQLSDLSKAYSVRVLETLNGIKLVKATANEEREYQLITGLIRDREQADFHSQVSFASIGPINEITSILVLIIIIFLGRSFFASQLRAISALLLTYLLVLFRLLPFISQLNNARSQLSNTSASMEIVDEFLQRADKPVMKNGFFPYTSLQEGINFQNISFSYPNHSELVLKNINLYLPRGTTLALVGASGAGKSTLADLLPRFYDPIAGSILIDGKDLKEFDIKTLRRAMGIVSQDTFLFNDSIRNNIAYSRPDATEKDIISAAKKANAYEFIWRLPQGLDTIIGDRGVLLSGGQRQRIAIARALLQDPDILILDEATSALDTVSERLVQTAIDNLSQNRTTLVIAHRLSTVQKAHQIAVLDRGNIIEVGSHEELLKKGGYYSHLYGMQFIDTDQELLETDPHQIAMRTSYELRTRLNGMIGFLGLIADGIVDNPEEQKELIQESYKSAVNLLRTLEFYEHNMKDD